MVVLGSAAPNFTLPDAISEKTFSHCPFVQHLNARLAEVARDYKAKGVSFVAIGSNDIDEYPEDGPEMMQKVAAQYGYSFPYLFDATQDVARAYQAVCTPDFFIFDGDLKLSYRGRFDETRPGMGRPTGKDMAEALDNLIAGKAVDAKQFPSMGCSMKWK
eukprot:GHVN01052556.1.p1 GENE.GHVN01052556.1~~GHVN01052556.1.p1  ORF type:complete len:171 (+),score=10.45 GHVN01052556.1:34-513(+)